MINPETRALIRRYFYAEHWKIGTIASELNVHPDTVRNAIESERFHPAAIGHGKIGQLAAFGIRQDHVSRFRADREA